MVFRNLVNVNIQSYTLGRGGDSLDGSGLVAVLELAVDNLEVTLTAGSGCVSALGLLAPVVRSDFGGGVSTRRASLLLAVERTSTASSAESVRLVVAFTEAGSSLWRLVFCDLNSTFCYQILTGHFGTVYGGSESSNKIPT